MEDIEPDDRAHASGGEGETSGVGDDVVPGRTEEVRGDPAQIGAAGARGLGEEAGPGADLEDPRLCGNPVEKTVEPGAVDGPQLRLGLPDAPVLEEPLQAHRNFSLRAANALIPRSSHPWRKREMFVSP
jgi:hypothetical protein